MMGRRRYTADFKRRLVVEAMRGDQTVQAIAVRHETNPNQLSRWKTEAEETTQTTPEDATHWSCRSMARHLGTTHSSVNRVWRAMV